MSDHSKIAFNSNDQIHFLNKSDIHYCIIDKNYCHIFTSSRKKITILKNLKNIEFLLCNDKFCRINHSTIVNLDEVKNLMDYFDPFVVMSDGSKFQVSRRKKSFLDTRIENVYSKAV
ncbi:MAG: LytTR family DNA-binding domain-containing protein [Saprospiraceae bacterium]